MVLEFEVSGFMFDLQYRAAGLAFRLGWYFFYCMLNLLYGSNGSWDILSLLQVARVCSNCGVNMGEYFCDMCKFYDDEVRWLLVIWSKLTKVSKYLNGVNNVQH